MENRLNYLNKELGTSYKSLNDVDWSYISQSQQLSEDFIREFKDKVNWNTISFYQKLSEDFIREFKDKVDWYYISSYQKLSEDFIRDNKDKVNWLYKSSKFKEEKIRECGLYECYDDYFIAYKAIRNDRYSHFNFQYQYLPGNTYESHCDCTDEENSFGLSVWTEEKALQYNNSGIIVKCKVKYEDVGRLVHNNGKIRCFKIEILDN